MSLFIHPQVLSLELACQDDRHYDTSTLSSLLSMFNKAKLKDKHFVICCTVMPGYVRHTGRYLIRDCENCTLSYNPEFIAQGDVINGLLKPVLQSSSRHSPPLVNLLLSSLSSSCHSLSHRKQACVCVCSGCRRCCRHAAALTAAFFLLAFAAALASCRVCSECRIIILGQGACRIIILGQAAGHGAHRRGLEGGRRSPRDHVSRYG